MKKNVVITCVGVFVFFQLIIVYYLLGDVFYESKKKNVSMRNLTVMNIAYATDDNYSYPTFVSILSIAVNSDKDILHNITILYHPEIPSELRLMYNQMEKEYSNIRLNFIDMGNRFANLPKLKWSVSMYYRMLLADLLHDVELCLYCDGDVMIRGYLSRIFQYNMRDYYIAGTQDFNHLIKPGKDYYKKLKIPDAQHYVSSGVLLMNLGKIRKDNMTAALCNLAFENKNSFVFPDQDALNSLFYGHILLLSTRDVALAHTYRYSRRYASWTNQRYDEWERASKDPLIFHFTGVKPWNRIYSSFCEEWWHIVNGSPFGRVIRDRYSYRQPSSS